LNNAIRTFRNAVGSRRVGCRFEMFDTAIQVEREEVVAALILWPIVRTKEFDSCIGLILREFLETFKTFEYYVAGLVVDAVNPAIATRFVNEDDKVAVPVDAWG
jgi:hypothetical protein